MPRHAHDDDVIDPAAAFAADVRPPARSPAEIPLAAPAHPAHPARRPVRDAITSTYAEPAAVPPAYETAAPPARLVSLDAFRGLVMVLMVSAGLRIGAVVKNMERDHVEPSATWRLLAYTTDHPEWHGYDAKYGFALWDFIQPGFMFMVGTAMAFSLASRRAKGHSFGRMLGHAVWRSVLLVGIAVFLTSNYNRGTVWEFTNVLAQIGLGYTFLFLVAWLKPRWQCVAALAILAAYWGLFAWYPKPPAGFDGYVHNLKPDWERLEDKQPRFNLAPAGFQGHWEKNVNAAAKFDRWFLNLFPQVAPRNAVTHPRFDPKAYPADAAAVIAKVAPSLNRWAAFVDPRTLPVPAYDTNSGGYQTLNFVPSLATMIFGLIAGEWVRRRDRGAGLKFAGLLVGGLVAVAIGIGIDQAGWCPLVKRIWTPSWAIFCAGVVLVGLSVFYLVIDVARLRAWALPLVVVGMNSIAIYYMSMSFKPWVRENLYRHFGGEGLFENLSRFFTGRTVYAPMFDAGIFLLFCWLVVWWMYRKKVFIRI